jgi:peptidoglycan hydrolase CwlO-like protein
MGRSIISQIESSFDDYDLQISDLESDLEERNSEIDSLQETIAERDETILALEEEINALKAELTPELQVPATKEPNYYLY